jgi:hypothetical protein
MNLLPNLSTNPNARQVIKKPLPLKVTFASQDGICQTLEGSVSYRKGDAILTGIAEEKWPVSRIKFDDRYVPLDDIVFGHEGMYIKKPKIVLALKLEVPMSVTLEKGDILEGKSGDWLLHYSESEFGIVKDEIFRATYDFYS